MNSCPAKSKLPFFVALAAGALILSAQAQESGQSIIFSAPQSLDGTPSLAPQNPNQLNLPETLQAPPAIFQSSAGPAPMPQARQLSPAEQQRIKTAAQNQNNWAFATPEEIFGVADSQPAADASTSDDKNQTPFERYLDRQTQARIGNTNSPGNSPWNFSHDQNNAIPFDPSSSGFGNSVQGLSQFLNGAPKDRNTPDNVAIGQNPNQYGGSLLNAPQPTTPTQPDLEQQAAMERFRQLLNPAYGAADAAAQNNQFFPAPKAAMDPNITQPDFTPNPMGASFTPLSSKIDRPAGLPPLPSAVQDHSQDAVAQPAWAPKPAPWLSQTPQPYAIPQRKF